MSRISETEEAILKTIACYEALGQYPLTAIEIYCYLQKENLSQPLPKLLEIMNLLAKSLLLKKYLGSQNGFFFFKENSDFYQKRIYRNKISISKWRKVKRISVFLGLVPFLRGAAINGSLAINNTKPESDIDFLVFAKKGRIWTCRALLSFFLEIIGQRRHGIVIADKICLNHYIAEGSFLVTIQNTPNAQLYSRLIPLINYTDYQSFQEKNIPWLKDFIVSPFYKRQNHLRRIDEKSAVFRIGKRVGLFFESILDMAGGKIIEKALGKRQKERILAKTNRQPIGEDKLLLSDSMLMFHHPICKNREVMEAYKKRLSLLFPSSPPSGMSAS